MNILEIFISLFFGSVELLFVSYLLTVLFVLINKATTLEIYKKNFIKFWLVMVGVFIVNRAIHIFLPNMKWLKFIVILTVTPINAKLFYKIKLYKGAIIAILYSVLSAILEVVLILALKVFDIEPINIVSNVLYNSCFACAIALFEAALAFVIYKITTIYNTTLASVENKLKYFIPQLIAIIICMFPTMALLMFNYFKYSALFIVINLLQLFVVAFVGVYNLKFVVKHENTELKLANTIIYNETLSKVNEGVRGFKHDMGNIVQAIL